MTPGRPPRTYGRGGGKHLTVRFTDRKVALDIIRNPRLGLGEAYMDGRLIDRGRDHPRSARADRRRQPLGGRRKGARRCRKGKRAAEAAVQGATVCAASRRNVAHHYDLKDELYEIFLDDDRQYSCAYFTDPATASNRRRPTRRRISPRSFTCEPGSGCSTSAAAGAGWRSTCTRSPASTCSASPYRKSS